MLVVRPQVIRLLRPGAAIPNIADGLGTDIELLGDGCGSSCQERVCPVAVGLDLTVRIDFDGLGRCEDCPRVILGTIAKYYCLDFLSWTWLVCVSFWFVFSAYGIYSH